MTILKSESPFLQKANSGYDKKNTPKYFKFGDNIQQLSLCSINHE